MAGLRTHEDGKFVKFIDLVQAQAKKQGKVFFLECEDGHDASFDDMDVAELTGWLVPQEKAEEFEAVWLAWKEDDDWVDFYISVTWKRSKFGKIKVKFEEMPDLDLSDFGIEDRRLIKET